MPNLNFPQSIYLRCYNLFSAVNPINRTVSMLIGGLTQLTCAPYPNSPRVVWVKNGELVIPSFRMLAAAGFLWLFGVGPGEEGDYSCVTPGGHVIETYYIDIMS